MSHCLGKIISTFLYTPGREADRQDSRQTDRQTRQQADRQTDKTAGRHTADRQTGIQRKITD